MNEIDDKACCRIIYYYSSLSLTDGSCFLYGYKEGEGLTGNVVVKELGKVCH